MRTGVIAFLDRLSEAPRASARIVVINNAANYKAEAMDSKLRLWAARGLYFYYLSPYSPEPSRIEILWKQAKSYWRRFCSLRAQELLNEVNSIFNALGQASQSTSHDDLAKSLPLPMGSTSPALLSSRIHVNAIFNATAIAITFLISPSSSMM